MTEAKFTEAAALFTAKKYYEAVTAYASIAAAADATDSDRARALNNISACYASTKEYDKSLQSALLVLELQPANVKALGRAATAHEGLQQYEEAASFFAKALEQETARNNNTSGSGDVCSAGLARVRALLQAKRGVASSETKDKYYYAKSLQKGKEAMAAGNHLEAMRQFTKALELFPCADGGERERAILLANRSAAGLKAGSAEQSADDALLATQTDPTYARGFFRLACAKHQLKKAGDAYDALGSCLRLDPTHTEARALLEDVEPVAKRERMTAAERAAASSAAVAALKEKQTAEHAEAAARVVVGRHAHASSYVYCSYCNESGHTRADCPLRRKRPRL